MTIAEARARTKKWRDANPDKQAYSAWKSNIKQKYGLTPEDFDRILVEQGGACAICGRDEPRMKRGGVKRLSVDHCHDTGRVRGLLCSPCNTSLGAFHTEELLDAAKGYLCQSKS